MRNLNELDKYRYRTDLIRPTEHSGVFRVSVGKRIFQVIATVDNNIERGGKIEHVSVSHRNPKVIPSWDEMCAIKDMFFLPEEECVQMHPAHSEYVNLVENCLHIWRPVNGILKLKGAKHEHR